LNTANILNNSLSVLIIIIQFNRLMLKLVLLTLPIVFC